jgi:capsular polysaccharide biosynthesis protein
MSQQALDVQRSMQIVRRHKVLVGVFVTLGILAGAAYVVLKPPMLTSTALIALPIPQTVQPATSTGVTDPFTATQEIVASSYQVLLGALPNVHPAMPLNELRNNVEVGSPSPDIISVTAKGKNAAQAKTAADAVANSYISYVGSSHSAVGRVRAHLLEPAISATGPSRIERTIIYALLGGIVGLLIGVIVALAIGRNDRRLRQRDEIANSIGIPVLASVPVAHPSAAKDWMKLLEVYRPNAVHSWQLRSALQQLGMASPAQSNDGSFSYEDHRAAMYDRGRSSLAVLSLSSDSGALALGPQLAVFAASQGTPTLLVVGPQQDAAATATLRTACSGSLSEASERNGLLRVIAYDEGDIDIEADTALVIVVAVVDGRAPKMPQTVRTSATVIGVSAGAASAEQLARAAVVAATDGREVTGILVADPDEDDQTTGRIPHLARPVRRRLPNRLRGIVTEIRR